MGIGKLTRYGLPFANVVNNGQATNMVVPGKTLENMRLKLGGTSLLKSMIERLKIKANGKVIIEGSGTQIDKVNAYRGEATNAAFLDIQFADYTMLGEVDRMIGAFDTGLGISTITSEVKIVGATAPTLDPILIESANQKQRDGSSAGFAPFISKLLAYPYSVATGGKLPLTVPFGPQNGAVIKRLHVFHTGNLKGVTVKLDSLPVHESIKVENEFDQVKAGRVPQANCYTVDFVLDGNVSKALDTRDAKSLEWLLDFSGADSGEVLVEYLDPLGNL